MQSDADLRRDVEQEGLESTRQAPGATAGGDEPATWRPLLAAVAGIFLTLAILVIGLAPTWAVITAVSVVGIVLAAIVAMAWGITRVRRPTHEGS